MNKTYCYNMRSAVDGHAMVGGMLHAESMEDAARRAITYCKATVSIEGSFVDGDSCRYRLHARGTEVFISVSAHPENLYSHEELARLSERT